MTDLLERIAKIGERICASNPLSTHIKTKQNKTKQNKQNKQTNKQTRTKFSETITSPTPETWKPHQTRLRMLHEFAQSAWPLWSANLKA